MHPFRATEKGQISTSADEADNLPPNHQKPTEAKKTALSAFIQTTIKTTERSTIGGGDTEPQKRVKFQRQRTKRTIYPPNHQKPTEAKKTALSAFIQTTIKTTDMDNVIKTSVGNVSVKQTEPNVIEIKLTSSEQHTGTVTVKVTNEVNGDFVNLKWIK